MQDRPGALDQRARALLALVARAGRWPLHREQLPKACALGPTSRVSRREPLEVMSQRTILLAVPGSTPALAGHLRRPLGANRAVAEAVELLLREHPPKHRWRLKFARVCSD